MDLNSLPIDLINHISQDLPTYQILNLCQTNKNILKLCNSDELWVLLLQRDFGVRAKTKDPRG